ncbi:MAG: cryptochrome/photolyase family protein, partial [Pseudomonadota bacterium]
MTTALLIFPNQLFAEHPALADQPDRIVLIEDSLFFGDPQYSMTFHKQKLWLHRASMTRYAKMLKNEGEIVETVRYQSDKWILKETVERLANDGVKTLHVADPVDYTLTKRLNRYADAHDLDLKFYTTPMFLNTPGQNREWRDGQKRWFMAEFYKFQRKRLDILMENGDPVGGKWSYDEDNRKKVPKKLQGKVPQLQELTPDDIEKEARDSIL